MDKLVNGRFEFTEEAEGLMRHNSVQWFMHSVLKLANEFVDTFST